MNSLHTAQQHLSVNRSVKLQQKVAYPSFSLKVVDASFTSFNVVATSEGGLEYALSGSKPSASLSETKR